MKLKLITLIVSAVISLTSCSTQTAVPKATMELTPSPVAMQISETQTPASTEKPVNTVLTDNIPKYNGEAYITLNNNVPDFADDELTTDVFETYSSLDALGRCGEAYANICKEIMPTEERGKIGQIKPSGWHTIRYDFIDGMYLYNRCHLIAYQLAGENANEQNLITGTRYLNIQGMLPFENRTAEYVNATGNHVLYRVTPMYEGNNLLAYGVHMEAKSVEDNGAGLSFNVFCYNVQPGVVIDYATGESWREENADTDTQETEQNDTVTPVEASASNTTYILNTNTKKFHYPTCSSVSDMSDKNKREFTGTRDEAIAQGYVSCKRCNP